MIECSIPGYDCYLASEDGSIWSLRGQTKRLLAQQKHNGYLHVKVRTERGRLKEPVHKLVLLAFVGPKPYQQAECRHLNGDALDNRSCNLAWGSRRENHEDAISHGTATCLKVGQRHPHAKLTDRQVLQIRAAYAAGATQASLGTRYGVSQRHVSDLVRHRSRVA